MVPKALGLTLLAALKRQDTQCQDYCPFGTMTLDVTPTEVVVQQPIHITGYFSTNGPVTLAPNIVATVTGAPGVIDTVITFVTTDSENSTMYVALYLLIIRKEL